MRSAHITRRQRAQRARRDAESEQRPPSPALPDHGDVVGSITLTLHGRTAHAELLATGHHCRSYGVRIDGAIIAVAGADRAWPGVCEWIDDGKEDKTISVIDAITGQEALAFEARKSA